eukprot:gene28490-31646_t
MHLHWNATQLETPAAFVALADKSVTNQEAGKAVTNQEAGKSVTNQEAGKAVTNQEAGKAVTNQEAGKAVTNQEAGKAVTNQEAGKANCVSQLRAQCGDDGELPGLLSLRHILDTIHESPSLRYLAAALSKSADSQNVPIVEALLYDQGIQVKLAMADHPLEALVLRILGHQHQAWDSPHLTWPVRCNRMANLHWLLREATLPALNGLVSELAKWANNDVKQKCLGFTTHLLFVFMANIEGHMQSMKNHPSAARLFVDRAASTDDLETEFSLVR